MAQLDRSLDVLELLADRGEAGVAELVTRLGTPRASVYRLLATLQARGYVERAPGSRKYRVGLALRSLAARSTETLVVSLAAPALADLRAVTGETTNIGVVTNGRILYAAT